MGEIWTLDRLETYYSLFKDEGQPILGKKIDSRY